MTLIAWSKNDNLVVVLNSALRSTAFVDTKVIYYDWLITVCSVLRNGEIIKYHSVDSTVDFVYNIVTSSGT